MAQVPNFNLVKCSFDAETISSNNSFYSLGNDHFWFRHSIYPSALQRSLVFIHALCSANNTQQSSRHLLPAMFPVFPMLNTSCTIADPTYSPSGVGKRTSCILDSTDSIASYTILKYYIGSPSTLASSISAIVAAVPKARMSVSEVKLARQHQLLSLCQHCSQELLLQHTTLHFLNAVTSEL